MRSDWNITKCVIAYDPRITHRDFELEEEDSLNFRPSLRQFPSKLYDRPEFDQARFAFFEGALANPDATSMVGFLIPMVRDVLLPRNPSLLARLLSAFAGKAALVEGGRWLVGSHEVLVVRVLARLIVGCLASKEQQVEEKLVSAFLEHYCEFPRVLSGYKMEEEAEELLKLGQQLLIHENYRAQLRDSCGRTLVRAAEGLLGGRSEGQQEKVRKNRLRRCLQF